MNAKSLIKEFFLLILPAAGYIYLHVHYSHELYVCWYPYFRTFLAISIGLGLMALVVWVRDCFSEECFGVAIMLPGTGFMINGVFAFIYTVQMFQSDYGHCIPPVVKYTNLIVTFAIAVLILFGLAVIVVVLWYGWSLSGPKKKFSAARLDLYTLYDNLGKEDFDLEKFLKKHKYAMQNMAFTETDLATLSDKFGEKLDPEWKADEGKTNLNHHQKCRSCSSIFEGGDYMIKHPQCGHSFHYECLKNWLIVGRLEEIDSPRNCPTCKIFTRSAMFRDIRRSLLNIPNLTM